MFESTLVDNRSESRRPLTVAVSFLAQSALVLLAVLIPLLTTQSLPTHNWMAVLLAPPPPLGAPPAAPRTPQPARRAPLQRINTDALVAPATIPEDVALLVDATAPPTVGRDRSIRGVAGSIPGGTPSGAIGSIVSRMLNRRPLPPPPPAAAVPPKLTTRRSIWVSEGVQSARLIHQVLPPYPFRARHVNVQGIVRLEAVIGRDGSVRKLKVTSGHPLLIPAAIEAVQQWRYRPTLLNGEAVEVFTQVEVRFVLR